jgi:hypothetical protein
MTTGAANVRMLGINASDIAYVGPIDTGALGTIINASTTSNYVATYTAGTEKMRVISSGNVGIGTSTPGYKLQVGVAADGSEARANAWNVLSDERLKRDFEIIPEALEKILSLNGYFYHWNRCTDTFKKIGLKAQDVENVFPEVVSHGKYGFLSVSYNHLVAGLISAFKEFHRKWISDSSTLHREIASNKNDVDVKLKQRDQEIEKLKNEIARLEKNNSEVDKRLRKLEQSLKK